MASRERKGRRKCLGYGRAGIIARVLGLMGV